MNSESDRAGSQLPRFGVLLRAHRSRSGFSQEALAERAALSAAAVSALEQETRRAPYAHTVGRLADALDLQPSERDDLERAADRARGRRQTHSIPAPPSSQNNLPVMLTSFINRPEIDELTQIVAQNRLVTITGPGGIGKTRSAVEVATRSLKQGPEMIRFLDLSEITDGDSVLAHLANILGAPIATANDTLNAVKRTFATHQFLLLLDNCEHLLDAVAILVEALLKACRGLSILATSREPLGLSSETVYRLPSLRKPETAVRSIAEARSYEALDLFLTRAQAADARVALADDRIGLISEICDKLDGIPLAIELATARLPTLGLETLATRLSDLLRSPSGRDRPPRQQTMEATIAWSYELLTNSERLLLRRLCVFAGGFTLDAAEHVCSDDLLPEMSIEVHLSQLVKKSLINLHERENNARYTILESIRAFASRRLEESGENDHIAYRHAIWLAELADYLNEKRVGIQWDDYLPECENARTAIKRYALGTNDDALLAARIIGGFRLLLARYLPRNVLSATATKLLARVNERQHPLVALRLLWLLLFYELVPDRDQFQTLFDRAVQLCERMGNDDYLVATYEVVAFVCCTRGWTALADAALDRAAPVFHHGSVADRHLYASFLGSRAYIRFVEGRLDEARIDLQTLFGEMSDRAFDHERLSALITLAEVECAAGNYRLASECCREALQSGALRFDQRFIALKDLANYLLLLGDAAGAEDYARQAFSSPMGKNSPYSVSVIQHFATAAALRKQPILAARLLGYVDEWYRQTSTARLGSDRLVNDLLVKSLGEQLQPEEIHAHAITGVFLSFVDVTRELSALAPLDGQSGIVVEAHGDIA